MQWLIGQMVRSKQGRDLGQYYVIVKTEEKCCYLANGRKVTVNKSKKKNYKHLQGTLTISNEIKDDISKGGAPTDREIREFLNHHMPESGIKEE